MDAGKSRTPWLALSLGVLLLAPAVDAVLEGAQSGRSTPAAAPSQTTPSATPGRGMQTAANGQRGAAPGMFVSWEWWRDDEVKKELGLSDEKARKIDAIFQRRFGQIRPYADEFQKEWEKLDRMTRERVADESTYGLQVNRVEMLYARVRESRTSMLYAMYLELTPDQYKKFVDIRERHNRDARGGRSASNRY